jgi:hypothetical protein
VRASEPPGERFASGLVCFRFVPEKESGGTAHLEPQRLCQFAYSDQGQPATDAPGK